MKDHLSIVDMLLNDAVTMDVFEKAAATTTAVDNNVDDGNDNKDDVRL